MAEDSERANAVRALVECCDPLSESIARVQAFSWDCDRELVVLDVAHIVDVLRRFLHGALTAEDVEHWADAIEMRDDVGCDSDCQALIFQLANPAINDAITDTVAESLLKRYDGRPTR